MERDKICIDIRTDRQTLGQRRELVRDSATHKKRETEGERERET